MIMPNFPDYPEYKDPVDIYPVRLDPDKGILTLVIPSKLIDQTGHKIIELLNALNFGYGKRAEDKKIYLYRNVASKEEAENFINQLYKKLSALFGDSIENEPFPDTPWEIHVDLKNDDPLKTVSGETLAALKSVLTPIQ
jgi:hypothetical protein